MNPDTMLQYCAFCNSISEFIFRNGIWICSQCGEGIDETSSPPFQECTSLPVYDNLKENLR